MCTLIFYMHIFLNEKNIPYLECFSTKTPWWTTLQPPYTLVHRTDELLGFFIITFLNVFLESQ